MESGNSSSLHSSSEAEDDYDCRSTADELSEILNSSSAFHQPPPVIAVARGGLPTTSTELVTTQPPLNPAASNAARVPAPARGSRKRSRASRRAPTTILTTDTSNFRQMVQQFTGVPSPPFSSLARPRLDLLHAASSVRLGLLDPSHLLRPFSHTVPPPSPPRPPLFPFRSAALEIPGATLPPCNSLPMQHRRSPTPVLTFQSLLQNDVPAGIGNLTATGSLGYVEEKNPINDPPNSSPGITDSSWLFSLDQ